MNSQTSERPSANAALVELVKLSRIEINQLEGLKPPRFQIRMANYCVIGLMFACLIAGIWIFNFLSTTYMASDYLTMYARNDSVSLLGFIIGRYRGAEVAQSTEALFVVTTRFFLGVGLAWVPLTLAVLVIDVILQAGRKRTR